MISKNAFCFKTIYIERGNLPREQDKATNEHDLYCPLNAFSWDAGSVLQLGRPPLLGAPWPARVHLQARVPEVCKHDFRRDLFIFGAGGLRGEVLLSPQLRFFLSLGDRSRRAVLAGEGARSLLAGVGTPRKHARSVPHAGPGESGYSRGAREAPAETR